MNWYVCQITGKFFTANQDSQTPHPNPSICSNSRHTFNEWQVDSQPPVTSLGIVSCTKATTITWTLCHFLHNTHSIHCKHTVSTSYQTSTRWHPHNSYSEQVASLLKRWLLKLKLATLLRTLLRTSCLKVTPLKLSFTSSLTLIIFKMAMLKMTMLKMAMLKMTMLKMAMLKMTTLKVSPSSFHSQVHSYW